MTEVTPTYLITVNYLINCPNYLSVSGTLSIHRYTKSALIIHDMGTAEIRTSIIQIFEQDHWGSESMHMDLPAPHNLRCT